MTIEKTINGTALTVAVAGRLDTVTAPCRFVNDVLHIRKSK